MGREGTGEGDPVDGRPGRHPSQPYPQGVLRAAFGCRQAQEGGLGSVHEEAALHPQRRDEGSRYLEVSSCPNPLTFKTVAFSFTSSARAQVESLPISHEGAWWSRPAPPRRDLYLHTRRLCRHRSLRLVVWQSLSTGIAPRWYLSMPCSRRSTS